MAEMANAPFERTLTSWCNARFSVNVVSVQHTCTGTVVQAEAVVATRCCVSSSLDRILDFGELVGSQGVAARGVAIIFQLTRHKRRSFIRRTRHDVRGGFAIGDLYGSNDLPMSCAACGNCGIAACAAGGGLGDLQLISDSA